MDYLKSILEDKSDFNAEILISLLSIDDNRIREILITKVDGEYNLDESRLVEAIKGSVWFVRAALVQILSNRNSEYLLEVIEYLLDDKNVEVKLKIIEALTKLDRESAVIYLKKLTNDPLIWVKKEAKKAPEATEKPEVVEAAPEKETPAPVEEEPAPVADKEEEKPKEPEKDNFLPTEKIRLEGPTILGSIILPEPKKAEKKQPVASSSDDSTKAKKKKRMGTCKA